MKKNLLSVLVVGLSLAGCSYPMEELGLFKNSGTELSFAKAFQNKELSFEIVKQTSLRTCLECHASGARAMGTATQVLAQKAEILDVIQSGAMPPRSGGYSPLSSCEKQILEIWLEDQLHNRVSTQKVGDLSACAGAEAPKEKVKTDLKKLELSYANLKKEILQPKCMVCHTAETAKRTVLDEVENLHDRNLLAETAEDSILYQVTVPGMNKRFMPPQRGKTILPPLTAEELDYMKRWIEAGAPK